MAEILGSSAGTFATAQALYASHGGEWVEVPLGDGGGGGPVTPTWTRPTDWLATNVGVGEQKIQLLAHVGADPTIETNRAMTVKATPDYTVDWGDGTDVENFTSGAVAKHLYDPTALAGTATTEGWLQALVTVTPQAAGSLASLATEAAYYTGKVWRSPVVEIVVGPPLTAFTTQTSDANSNNLARVVFRSPITVVDGSMMFNACLSLREILGEIRLSGLNHLAMFSGCQRLKKFPTLTFTSAGTTGNAQSMFFNCYGMTEVPVMTGTSSIATWTQAFMGCINLKEVPDTLDTSGATTLSTMFSGCTSLAKVGALNTSKSTSFNSMFVGCTYLTDVALFDAGNVTSFSQMFQNCTHLVTVPSFNTVKGLTFTSMFSGCSSMTDCPSLNFAAATGLSSMFYVCQSLKTFSLGIPQTVTNVASMFSSCVSLTSATGLNLAGPTSSTNLSQMFSGCSRLSKIGILPGKGPRFTFDALQSVGLDAAGLNDFYTQLPVVTGQTLYVGTTPGTLGDDPTIATAKGWTVSGS